MRYRTLDFAANVGIVDRETNGGLHGRRLQRQPGSGWLGVGRAGGALRERCGGNAALQALRALPGRIELVSDSTYVVNCFKQRWYATWLKNGWRNSQKKPVANRDLWEPFIELALAREASFRWVKGHGSDQMNAWVDELAVLAAQSGQGQNGSQR